MARTRRAAVKRDAPATTTDVPQAQAESGRGRKRQSKSKDAGLDKLADEDTTAVPTGTTGGGADVTMNSIENDQTVLATPSARRDTTGLDLADDVFGNLEESFAEGEVPRVPGSAETTVSWSNFRPRSRQSSIIGRNDPPIRPSSRASNTGIGSSFTIGAFRRRAREQSILATSRRPRSETSAAPSDLESEGEFAPEAESTPLNKRRRTRASLATSQRQLSVEAGPSRITRKRKSEAASGGDNAKANKSAKVTNTNEEDSDSELSELGSPNPRTTTSVLLARPVTPMNDDEIMAPPASSGSEDEGEATWPDIHTLAKRRRRPSVSTPVRGDHHSDISSPPSLTHSPNLREDLPTRSRAGNTSAVHKSPKITTADLANLLPKRRYKKTPNKRHESGDEDDAEEEDDEDDNEDDDVEEDEQEKTTTRSRGKKAKSRTRSRVASRASGLASTTSNGKQTPTSTRPARRTASKKYGRRSSDKENDSNDDEDEHDESAFQPLPDDTFPTENINSVIHTAEELKQAVKKFVEVDKWELEFEEVAESYSPKGAR